MGLKLITGPELEPLTLPEVKAQLRRENDYTDEDTLLEELIADAREYCESPGQNRAFLTQTWEISLDRFPRMPLNIPRPPLQSVESIIFKDAYGVETIYDPAKYVVDTASEPGRINHAYGRVWPLVVLWTLGAVRIRFKAGYGDTPDKVPLKVKRAMKLLIAHWYENREIISADKRFESIPFGVDALLGADRVANC
jgi:uncharacterized phiE125 gp8 family phage protein